MCAPRRRWVPSRVSKKSQEIADLIGKLHDIALNRRILELAEEVAALMREKRRADHRVEEVGWASKFQSDPSRYRAR